MEISGRDQEKDKKRGYINGTSCELKVGRYLRLQCPKSPSDRLSNHSQISPDRASNIFYVCARHSIWLPTNGRAPLIREIHPIIDKG
jgi:hypothetical protein